MAPKFVMSQLVSAIIIMAIYPCNPTLRVFVNTQTIPSACRGAGSGQVADLKAAGPFDDLSFPKPSGVNGAATVWGRSTCPE